MKHETNNAVTYEQFILAFDKICHECHEIIEFIDLSVCYKKVWEFYVKVSLTFGKDLCLNELKNNIIVVFVMP